MVGGGGGRRWQGTGSMYGQQRLLEGKLSDTAHRPNLVSFVSVQRAVQPQLRAGLMDRLGAPMGDSSSFSGHYKAQSGLSRLPVAPAAMAQPGFEVRWQGDECRNELLSVIAGHGRSRIP